MRSASRSFVARIRGYGRPHLRRSDCVARSRLARAALRHTFDTPSPPYDLAYERMTDNSYHDLSPAFSPRTAADVDFLRGIDGTTGFRLFWIDVVKPLLAAIGARE